MAFPVVFLLAGTFGIATASADDEWLDNPATVEAEPSQSSFVPKPRATTRAAEPNPADPRVSATQAAAQVRREHGGRVLSVNTARRGDSLGYHVRLLLDGGRVKTVYVLSSKLSSKQESKQGSKRDRDRPQIRSVLNEER